MTDNEKPEKKDTSKPKALIPDYSVDFIEDNKVSLSWYIFLVEFLEDMRRMHKFSLGHGEKIEGHGESIKDHGESIEKLNKFHEQDVEQITSKKRTVPFANESRNAQLFNGHKAEWYTDIPSRLGLNYINNAYKADLATEALTFGGFNSQWYQDRLDGTIPVPKAINANNSINAQIANSAFTAGRARNADEADKAKFAQNCLVAGRAANADEAKKADTANYATQAGSTVNAINAEFSKGVSRIQERSNHPVAYLPSFCPRVSESDDSLRVPETNNLFSVFYPIPFHDTRDPPSGSTNKDDLPCCGIGVSLFKQGEILFTTIGSGKHPTLSFLTNQWSSGTISSSQWVNLEDIYSDKKLKNKKAFISNAYDIINKIPTVRYEFKNHGIPIYSPTGTFFGFYAQDVKKVFPHMVFENQVPDHKEKFLSIKGSAKINFIAILWRAVQKLIKERNETRDDIPAIDEKKATTLQEAKKQARDLLRVCHSRAIRKATGGDTREQLEAKMMMADVARRDAKGTATAKETKMLTDAAKLAWVRSSRFRSDILKSMDNRNEKIFNLHGKVIDLERKITRARSIASVNALRTSIEGL